MKSCHELPDQDQYETVEICEVFLDNSRKNIVQEMKEIEDKVPLEYRKSLKIQLCIDIKNCEYYFGAFYCRPINLSVDKLQ